MKQQETKTEAVRIDSDVVKRARKYVESTRQTLSGFISVELRAVLDKVQPVKQPKK
jgi:hypothetical protein